MYRANYQGLYCVGCEQFYSDAELDGGICPDHGTPPQLVHEENWFFRLSKYAGQLHDLISSGTLRIEPAARRNEVLGFIAGGLTDFSASRSVDRARGWGIGVPGDPGQVIYVWWDALGNYITSLNFGARGAERADYRRWWTDADRRVHVVGKGVLRFHAVYWPAILLSAGQPVPTEIYVHDYLTVDGKKISKSARGGAADATDPVALASAYGIDALRWWLLREVPRAGDTDFTVDKLIARANEDLANGLGNLISRVGSIAHSYRNGVVQPCRRPHGTSRWLAAGTDGGPGGSPQHGPAPEWPADAGPLQTAVQLAPGAVSAALARYDFRAGTAAVWEIVEQANKYVEATAPWNLAKAERAGEGLASRRLDEVLGALVAASRAVAAELWPFLPDLAAKVAAACSDVGGALPAPHPVFPRIGPARSAASRAEGQYPAVAAGEAGRQQVSEVV